jgi:hypothetical protein
MSAELETTLTLFKWAAEDVGLFALDAGRRVLVFVHAIHADCKGSR